MPNKKYPWEIWIHRRRKFIIDPKEYKAEILNLAQSIRNKASLNKISVSIKLVKGKLEVLFSERT